MKGKILVIDDEPQIRRVIKAALSVGDFFAVGAKSAEEALDQFR